MSLGPPGAAQNYSGCLWILWNSFVVRCRDLRKHFLLPAHSYVQSNEYQGCRAARLAICPWSLQPAGREWPDLSTVTSWGFSTPSCKFLLKMFKSGAQCLIAQ